MSRTGGRARSLSPAAAVVLLGLFAVLALAVWLVSSTRSDGGAAAVVVTRSATSVVGATRSGATEAASTEGAATKAGASHAGGTQAGTTSAGVTERPATEPGANASLRAKALYVLTVVDATGGPPAGYVGGRQFMNDTRGGTTSLPVHSAAGRVVVYHEYDVNAKHNGVNRGPQRLVVGDDGSAWMTGDHYVTWQRLR